MYQMTEHEKKQMDECYRELEMLEKEIVIQNKDILKSCFAKRGKSFKKYLKRVIKENEVQQRYEPFEIVNSPTGDYQRENGFGSITGYWVSQWSTSLDGDSFSGYITIIIQKGIYLKLPFSC